ncbi:RICIN domain-containing protein [Streptomyces sp. NPDC001904]|uniref:RICIN domain-containing protein n=1 Tax=Streptomyces sp. NPDC001904 TaxID=3154531 RepID=UPI003324CCFE
MSPCRRRPRTHRRPAHPPSTCHGPSPCGSRVRVRPGHCNGGTNQKGKLNPDGAITGVQSGLCLDVTGGDKPAGNVNGTALELWTCNGGANQQWSLGWPAPDEVSATRHLSRPGWPHCSASRGSRDSGRGGALPSRMV